MVFLCLSFTTYCTFTTFRDIYTRMPKRIMIQCATTVDKKAVSRKIIDGVEHIIITSHTLPDNIVMNGGLYPAKEIASTFHTLERTLAPVEHPTDSDGNFISALDPHAIHNFHAGAFNTNVTRSDGRVHIEKTINVQEAMKSDKGKRLLDRIEELETNENPRPIHTSVGVFLTPEPTEKIMTNAEGQEYTWVANGMVFDHDAILLDNIGAAQPAQGVGMAVNTFLLDTSIMINNHRLADKLNSEINKKTSSASERAALISRMATAGGIEAGTLNQILNSDIDIPPDNRLHGFATVLGISFESLKNLIPNHNTKGEKMKEFIINALKEANIEVEGLDDTALFDEYNKLMAVNEEVVEPAEPATDINAIVANALAPLMTKVSDLEAKLEANQNKELFDYAEIVGNSDKYAGLTVDMCKTLELDDLKNMAANCASSHGIPLTVNAGETDEFAAPTTMPA